MISSVLSRNEPSIDLIKSIAKLANKFIDLKKAYTEVLEMGVEEGFTEKEIQNMIKDHLKGKMSEMQIRYLVNPNQWKEAAREQYQKLTEPKKEKSVNINETKKPEPEPETKPQPKSIKEIKEIVEQPTESRYQRELRELHEAKEKQEQEIDDAAIQAVKSLIEMGYNPDRGVNVIRGKLDQVRSELDRYKQNDDFIIFIQKI